jgi:hypothetical protein
VLGTIQPTGARLHAGAGIFRWTGWRQNRLTVVCSWRVAPPTSGHVLYAGPHRDYIYNPSSDRWMRAPASRYPHVNPEVAPTTGGALLMGGLNRLSSSERFFEP